MSKPIIAVVGATGAQGGAVARALVKNGKFAVRGLTRDTSAAKAKAIAVSQARQDYHGSSSIYRVALWLSGCGIIGPEIDAFSILFRLNPDANSSPQT
jgi:hypothetical protein